MHIYGGGRRERFEGIGSCNCGTGKSEIRNSRLEIQVRTDVVLSLNFVGQASRLETQVGFLCYSLKDNTFFRKP